MQKSLLKVLHKVTGKGCTHAIHSCNISITNFNNKLLELERDEEWQIERELGLLGE